MPKTNVKDLKFKRYRKVLGVTCAGGIFTFCGVSLMLELPLKTADMNQSTLMAWGVFVLMVLICTLYTAPFDYFSYRLGQAHGKIRLSRNRYIQSWKRGVSLQLILLPIFASLMYLAGRASGDGAAFGVFTLCLLFISWYRGEFARYIEGYQFRIFVPRKKGIFGARMQKAFFITLAWNQIAFASALNLPHAHANTITGMIVTILGFTCFSLLGWLFLPFISKNRELKTAILALDLSWAGFNMTARTVCTHVGVPKKWIGFNGRTSS